MKIELQQTSSRRIFRAFANGKELGEITGYGNCDRSRMASAIRQARACVKKQAQ